MDLLDGLTIDVILVSGSDGDWQGLYVDGKLIEENSSLSAARVLQILNGRCGQVVFSQIEVSSEWLNEIGNCLEERLEDIPVDVQHTR